MTVGSIVRLKSGGPLMTIGRVRGLEDDLIFTCYWFSPDGTNHNADYPGHLLVEDRAHFGEAQSHTPPAKYTPDPTVEGPPNVKEKRGFDGRRETKDAHRPPSYDLKQT